MWGDNARKKEQLTCIKSLVCGKSLCHYLNELSQPPEVGYVYRCLHFAGEELGGKYYPLPGGGAGI